MDFSGHEHGVDKMTSNKMSQEGDQHSECGGEFDEEAFVRAVFALSDDQISTLMGEADNFVFDINDITKDQFREFFEKFAIQYPDLFERVMQNMLENFPEQQFIDAFSDLPTKDQNKQFLDMEKFLLSISDEERARIGIPITETGRVLFTDDDWKIMLSRRKYKYDKMDSAAYLAELGEQMKTAELSKAKASLGALFRKLKAKRELILENEGLTKEDIIEMAKVEAEILAEESGDDDALIRITY